MEEYNKLYIIAETINKEFEKLLIQYGCDSLLGLFILDHIKASLTEKTLRGAVLADIAHNAQVGKEPTEEKEPIDLGFFAGVEPKDPEE